MGYYDADYKRMAKAANERIRQFEKRDMYSPAVLKVKAQLTMSGRRRFTETGKAASKEAAEAEKRILKQFLEKDKTGTVKGYKEYRQDILKTAEEKYDLAGSGVTKDQYLEMWASLDDDKSKRAFGSDVYIAILKTATKKYGADNMPDIKQMVEKMESAKSYKGALKAIGLKPSEVNRTLREMSE